MFETLVFLASLFGGGIAALAGFGIGSVITPFLATRLDMKLAVAAVSIPHIVGTALRLWYLRHDLDRRVMMTFGVASAAGGLTGAVLHSWLAGRALTYILAALLIFAGLTGVLGIQLRFGRTTGLVAGALSGLL
ncbi:MAG TPA: sulfite exporter TauE/SafE family protein, partial [Thermoanaerobaculia bacterium]